MRCKEVSAGGFGDKVFFLLNNIDEMGAMSLLRKYGGHWASNVGGKAWEMEPIARVQVTPGVREHHSYKSSLGGISGGAVNSLALSATLCGQSGLPRLWTGALRQREAGVGSWTGVSAHWSAPGLRAGHGSAHSPWRW